jgi:hypothetical protein
LLLRAWLRERSARPGPVATASVSLDFGWLAGLPAFGLSVTVPGPTLRGDSARVNKNFLPRSVAKRLSSLLLTSILLKKIKL